MDSDLLLIFPFVLILLAMVFLTISGVHKRHIAYKERREAFERDGRNTQPSASAEKIAQLEKRLHVLERIATDRGPDLAQQIEDLRAQSGEELDVASRELSR